MVIGHVNPLLLFVVWFLCYLFYYIRDEGLVVGQAVRAMFPIHSSYVLGRMPGLKK